MSEPCRKPRPPWGEPLKLLPLLVLYAAFVCVHAKSYPQWDEGRYLLNAHNLLKGYLASEETLFLWNGPGYPLYLVPFVAMGAPLILAKLGNAVFLFLAMAYFQGTLSLFSLPRSLAYAYALGVFLLLHGSLMEFLMTESLAVFLVCGSAYHFSRFLREPGSWLQGGAASLHLAYLALTKVFFGYPLLFFLLAAGMLALREKAREGRSGNRKVTRVGRAGAWVCGAALGLCLPYLAYTHSLTGKVFYWGNSGGSPLYCMTLPEKELLGDWLNFDAVLAHPDYFRGQVGFFRELAGMDYVGRDQALKKAALENLRAHPAKYFRNWRANVNRMVFGYPFSSFPGGEPELATGNRSFIYSLPFFLLLAAAAPGWLGRRAMPAAVHACFAFACVSLAGLSLMGAIPRLVFPLLPLLALWLACVVEKAVSLRGRW